MDWHWIERCAARFQHIPWHEYKRLPPHERAEVIADYREHNLREGIHAQRLKARDKNNAKHSIDVEDYL